MANAPALTEVIVPPPLLGLPSGLDTALGSGASIPIAALQLFDLNLDHAHTIECLRGWFEHLRATCNTKVARLEQLIGFVEGQAERWPRLVESVRTYEQDIHLIGIDGPKAAGRLFTRLVDLDEDSSVALYSFGDRALLADATGEVVQFFEASGLLAGDRRLLDFGCGTGRLLEACASRLGGATGVDVSAGMVAVARVRLQAQRNVRVEQIDGMSLDTCADSTFHVAVALDSWPYLVMAGPAVVERMLSEVARVLVAGGEFVILNYSYRWDLNQDIREVRALAGNNELTVVAEALRPFRLWDGAVWRLLKA